MARDYFVYPRAISAPFIVHHWLSIGGEIWKFLGKKLHAALHYARIAGYALHRNAKERIGRILRVPRVSRKAASPSFHRLSRPKRKRSRKSAHTRELYIQAHMHARVPRYNKGVTTRINAHVCLRYKLVFSAIAFMISNESTSCHPSSDDRGKFAEHFSKNIHLSHGHPTLLFCSTIAWSRSVHRKKSGCPFEPVA